MKNETARREIESLDYYLQNHTDDYSEESHTAMMMARDALEQEPCLDWYDVPSNEMTLEQARQAVKDLRKKLAEYLEQEPCEDIISRQVALDEVFEVDTKEYGRIEVVGVDAVMAIPSADKWIPVSERLPEEKMAVLVWCPEYKNIYCAYLEKKQWWIFGAFVQIIPYAVIAWMPLPPCYDPQESEDK